MTFPVVESVTRNNSNTDSTSKTVALPATVNAGDILIAFFVNDGGATVTWDSTTAGTWNLLFSTAQSTNVRLTCYWKRADGTEDGANLTITLSASERAAWQVYRISGCATTYGPEVSAQATGTSTAPNAASLSPTFGAQDTLWIAAFGADAATADSGSFAYPTNYTTNGIYDEANNTAGCGIGSSYRTNNTSSEDVGAFTIGASEQWVVCTVALCPALSAPTGPVFKSMAVLLQETAVANKPAQVSAGDIMFLQCVVFGSATANITGPSGWTELLDEAGGNGGGGLITSAVYYKIAGANEPATYSWSADAGSTFGSFVLAYVNGTFDAASPIDGTPTRQGGSGTTLTGLSVTTSVANSRLIFGVSGWGSITTPPSGMTQRLDVDGDPQMWDQAMASPGASGNKTATQSSSSAWVANLWALKAIATAAAARFSAFIIG